MLSKAITFVLLMVLAVAAWGKEAAPVAEDPVLERRLQTLSAELRCLVCQNESLAGSRAELAVDLRNQIRERMRQGQSDEEIVDYLVSRYGDFVLYRPPLKLTTLLLWLGPLLLSRRREAPAIELTGSERERARALLSDSGRERL